MSSVSLSSADVNGEEKPTDNGLTGQNFVCLQYPGVVENIQKAFETVGGLEDLSQVRILLISLALKLLF